MNKPLDLIDEMVLGRKLQHVMAGLTPSDPRAPCPLDVVRGPKKPVRTAERQEEIDALELANMGRMYA